MKSVVCSSVLVRAALLLALAGSSGCASFIPSDPRSQQKARERTVIEVHHKTKARAVPLLVAAAVPTACDQLLKFVSRGLKQEAAEYKAEYGASAADDLFYVPGARGLADSTEDREINIDRITVTRYIQIDGKDEVAAFRADFGLRPSLDQTAFQLVPLLVKMDYSKIKLARHSWLQPWSYLVPADGKIDIDVDMEIEAFWLDADGGSHLQPIAKLQLPLRGLTLGEERTGFGATATEWFPAIPVSAVKNADGSLQYGNGNFVFRARVSEVDDAGKRLAGYVEQLDENREGWVKQLLKNMK